MNVVNPRKRYYKKSYFNDIRDGTIEREDRMNNIIPRLRGTKDSMKKGICDLNAVIDEYGPVTWSFTVSPGEWNDSVLYQFLKDVNGGEIDTSEISISKLINKDPVSVSRFCMT